MASIARLLFAFVMLAGLGGAARAEISGPDQEAIRGMIASQIEAFRQDDGATAYSFASPNIQSLYPSPDMFMAMVRQGYPPVYRPQSVTFGPVVETPRGPLQKVFLTGPDGKGYVAIYTMQRQPDGTWKINGCVLVEADDVAI